MLLFCFFFVFFFCFFFSKKREGKKKKEKEKKGGGCNCLKYVLNIGTCPGRWKDDVCRTLLDYFTPVAHSRASIEGQLALFPMGKEVNLEDTVRVAALLLGLLCSSLLWEDLPRSWETASYEINST